MGVFGAGLTQTVTSGFMLVYTSYLTSNSTHLPVRALVFEKAVFEDIIEFMKIAVPSMAMFCLEQWSVGAFMVFATTFGTQVMGAIAIASNIFYTIFTVAFAF